MLSSFTNIYPKIFSGTHLNIINKSAILREYIKGFEIY